MKTLYRWMIECAACHQENGDTRGSKAILFALQHGARKAREVYPDDIPAIDNAIAYSKQEKAGGVTI